MKNKFWSFALRLELFIAGILLCKFAIFDYNSIAWETERILALAAGISLPIIGIIISLPKTAARPEVSGKLEAYSRYLIQAQTWCFLSLLIMELMLRVTIHNPPLRMDGTNWVGRIPSAHSFRLWGKEGYGITYYEKWGEVQTPFHDNRKDNDVIVFGDSQTECLQVDNSIKFTSVAETVIRADGYDLDLHNLGHRGFAMADYVSWLPGYQSIYKPKVIVVQLTDGDFTESFHENQYNYFVLLDNQKIDLVHQYGFTVNFTQKIRGYYNLTPQLEDIMNERRLLMQRASEKIPGQDPSPERFNPELADQQMQMLIAASNGTQLIVIPLPTSPYISGDKIEMADPAHEYLVEFLKRYTGIIIVDPLPEFQKLASAGRLPRGFFNSYPDMGHLNKYGNEIVGQLLAKAIEAVQK